MMLRVKLRIKHTNLKAANEKLLRCKRKGPKEHKAAKKMKKIVN